MIIVQITGGLGNQMFQYALICALKTVYPNQEIKADITDYALVHAHTGYSLEKYFQISLPIASNEEINQVSYVPVHLRRPDMGHGLKRTLKMLRYRFALKKQNAKKQFTISDYEFNIYNSSVFSLDTKYDWYLKGYWQNRAYFSDIISELRQLFQFRRPLEQRDHYIAKEMQEKESVFVHVRRGDYVDSGFDLCDKNYYLAAKKEIQKRVKNPHYYFFSDDYEYVKQSFSEFMPQTIIQHNADDCDMDMQLMSCCKHSINANSSFSFWGTALKQAQGMTVAPRYTSIKNHRWMEGPYMDGWVIIDNKNQ